MGRTRKAHLVLKSILYRFYTIGYEYLLALLLGYIGITAISNFIILNNMIKLATYLLFDLWWFEHIKTKFRILDRILEKTGLRNNEA